MASSRRSLPTASISSATRLRRDRPAGPGDLGADEGQPLLRPGHLRALDHRPHRRPASCPPAPCRAHRPGARRRGRPRRPGRRRSPAAPPRRPAWPRARRGPRPPDGRRTATGSAGRRGRRRSSSAAASSRTSASASAARAAATTSATARETSSSSSPSTSRSGASSGSGTAPSWHARPTLPAPRTSLRRPARAHLPCRPGPRARRGALGGARDRVTTASRPSCSHTATSPPRSVRSDRTPPAPARRAAPSDGWP